MACDLDDEWSALRQIVYRDDVNALRVEIEIHPEVLSWRTAAKGQNILHLAVSNGSIGIVRWLCESLSSSPLLDSSTNKWKETPLHLVAASGDAQMLHALLSAHQWDQGTQDKWERTPVDIALQMEHTQLLGEGLLLAKYRTGQSLRPTSDGVETLTTMRPGCTKDLFSALSVGVKLNQTSTVVRGIFEEAKSGHTLPVSVPQIPNSGAIHRIAISKLIEFPGDAVELSAFLRDEEGKYDINGRDMFGLTALHKFAAWDKVDLLDLLLAHPQVLVNVASVDGSTALHCAVDMDATGAVRRLLRVESLDRRATNKQGWTALDIAQAKELQEIVNMLH